MRKLIESVAAGIIVFHLAYLVLSYAALPATVPTHFNFAGEADAFGPKQSVWLIWFVSVGLYALLTGLAFIPLRSPLWNLPTSFKQDTTGRAKRLVGEMMAWFEGADRSDLSRDLLGDGPNRLRGSAEGLLITVLVAATLPPLLILGAYLSRMTAREDAGDS